MNCTTSYHSKNFLNLRVQKYIDAVEEISEVAKREYALEEHLDIMVQDCPISASVPFGKRREHLFFEIRMISSR